jgi:drug/metabolite transporter (DMT)-like permease
VSDYASIPGVRGRADRRPLVGYAMVVGAAALFAFNGTVSKVVLVSGLPAQRLTELRSAGAFLALAALLLAFAPRTLRLTRREIPFLLFYGIAGFAFVQFFYFVALEHLPVGIALLVQYTAPVFVALWARFGEHEPVRRRMWGALALALAGLALVAEIWGGLALDGVGVAAGFAAAISLAIYWIVGEHGVGTRDPLSLNCWAFLVSALFWSILQPWWSFPWEELFETTSLLGNLAHVELPVWLLCLWIVTMGSILPFGLVIGALRHLPATRVGVTAMLEPVLAALVAYAWLGETLTAMQLLGGLVVLAGVVLAQTAR